MFRVLVINVCVSLPQEQDDRSPCPRTGNIRARELSHDFWGTPRTFHIVKQQDLFMCYVLLKPEPVFSLFLFFCLFSVFKQLNPRKSGLWHLCPPWNMSMRPLASLSQASHRHNIYSSFLAILKPQTEEHAQEEQPARATKSETVVQSRQGANSGQSVSHGPPLQGQLRGSQGRGFEPRSTRGFEQVKNREWNTIKPAVTYDPHSLGTP